jgi:hypothetical protein
MLILVALMAGAASPDADQRLSRMTALYEQVCLKAFPDDKAVEAIMTAQKARPLTAEEVKVTMRDDPARGWELEGGSASVWVEFPPYHACSVRWNSPDMVDFSEYRAIADRYERAAGSFSAMEPYDADQGEIHVHAVGEQRSLEDGGMESLFIFDQHISDEKRRAAGETGYVLRFVHQIASPDAR